MKKEPYLPTFFIGGPFSSALTIENDKVLAFDDTVKSALFRIYDLFKAQNFGLFSSHIAENFGEIVDETTLVQRDNSWLQSSDAYVAVLPFVNGAPPRTDGTFVEIGLALGLGVPCVLLAENIEDPQWSYYIRNLHRERGVLVLSLHESDETILQSITKFVAVTGGRFKDRVADRVLRDPHVIHALSIGGKLGHTIEWRDGNFDAPAGALTSRFCECLPMVTNRVIELCTHGPVLDIGAGIGELAAIAADGAGQKVIVWEPDQAQRQAAKNNLASIEKAENIVILNDLSHTTMASLSFSGIMANFPPVSTGIDRFESRRMEIKKALAEILATTPPDTPVLVNFCTRLEENTVEVLSRELSELPLDIPDEIDGTSDGFLLYRSA